jgi:REP element-mobilizing transposase RayT
MKYNPDKHHRRSIRLNNYDYTQLGWYFVTIVTQNREMIFGYIANNKMILNDFGRIVNYHWEKLPIHFNNINLDEFQIMPNHIHGIIQIVGAKHSDENDDVNNRNCDGKLVGAKHSLENDDVKIKNFNGNASPLHSPENDDVKIKNCRRNASPQPPNGTKFIHPTGTTPGSLGAIMQNFQSVTTRKINRIRKTPGFKLWQRNYYEHIIRDENELNRIRKYILTNPAKWENDENNINSPQRQSNEKMVRAMHSPKK